MFCSDCGQSLPTGFHSRGPYSLQASVMDNQALGALRRLRLRAPRLLSLLLGLLTALAFSHLSLDRAPAPLVWLALVWTLFFVAAAILARRDWSRLLSINLGT